ncbi:MAG TPA: hypothetical protein VJ821_05785 [Anaerolineales bacterium]|nr:hypothetical protein [Anaerolineales bacterium]
MKQPKETESSHRPRRLPIVIVAILASVLTYLLVGLLITFLGAGYDVGFRDGFPNLFISLPFTFLGVWLYRKTNLPARFELPAAIAGGLAGLICVGALLFRY